MKRNQWCSIHRINVRVVTALCFACALTATGWVAYRLSVLDTTLPADVMPAHGTPPADTLWQGNETQEPAWEKQNPFHSPFLDHLTAQRAQKATQRRTATVAQTKTKATQQTAPKPAAPNAETQPQPQTITLIYRGLLTSVDGTTVAMIERNDPHDTVLLEVGDRFGDVRLKDIDRHGATVSLGENEKTHRLPVGKRITLTPLSQEKPTS